MATDESFTSWIEYSLGETIRFGDLARLMATALHGETFATAGAEINLEDELPKLVRAGVLTPRDPLTGRPHRFPVGEALKNARLRLDDELRAFLAESGIGLRIVPRGAIEVQPAEAARSDFSSHAALGGPLHDAEFIPCLDVLKEAAALRYPMPADGDEDAQALALAWQQWALAPLESSLNRHSLDRKLAVFVDGKPVPSFRSLHSDPVELWTVDHAGRAQLLQLLRDDPVMVRPAFDMPAWPREVPRLLRLLPQDAQILLRWSWRRVNMISSTPADAIATIEEGMRRQTEGWFTLSEAAQVLAEMRPDVNRNEAIKRFRLAHAKGALPIHTEEGRFLREAGEDISESDDLLKAADLDAWLRQTAGYGFAPAGAAEPLQPLLRDTSGRARRWTAEALDTLREYRKSHGSKKAAEWAGISEQRLRALLPGRSLKAKGYSAFNQHSK